MICSSGLIPLWPGVVHYSDLRRAGVTDSDLRAAVRSGEISRITIGWYALPTARRAVVEAVRLGGSLSGPSAATEYGLWVPPHEGLHLSLARGSHHPSERTPRSNALCAHWKHDRGRSHAAIEPLITVLQHCVECMSEELAITCIDSALNSSLNHRSSTELTVPMLERAWADLPRRYLRALERCDASSESGVETLVRLRLRARRIRVRTQVRYPNIGRVDLVVGDRFVIEIDGRESHDTEAGFVSDRERDLHHFDEERLCLRLTYHHVMFRWAEVEKVLLRRIRHGDHLWPRSRRYAGLR